MPLAVLELYFRTQDGRSPAAKAWTGVLVLALTTVMAAGIFGAVAFMWGPYMAF